MDIQASSPYPASALSNFAAHDFVFRGISCASMEGLLQSLKFQDTEVQKQVCLLAGKKAKDKGLAAPDWRASQTLWWQGKPLKRDSDAYQLFLDEAYTALFLQNADARKALIATQNETLSHSIGLKNRAETILTEQEFCGSLTRIRLKLQIKNESQPPVFKKFKI